LSPRIVVIVFYEAKMCLRIAPVDSFAFFSQSTPLHLSARNGHVEVCRLLLQCNADVKAKDEQ
jgi:ankyrin repeat protein